MHSKNYGINVRVTEQEKQKLLENARFCSLTLSEYLRRLGLGKEVRAAITERDYRLFRMLNGLKKLAQEGVLDDQMIYAVLAETKPNQQEQLKFKREELRKYFPSGYTEEQMRRDIIKGLELLKRQRERNRDAR